ncbi:hypothetical protein [Rhizobium rhizophilum]|uniref:Toxin-antitoxin system HicB family antitoxin n=1 Tax=Rhizobium rhizophilum TaxID=1850373 RepID=A0ABY2QXT5_9HYPH|nr:hypothetical protein [Rhizobium rhizophilum]THV14255.1 hypothetical protein E9677_15405 [Rhizobium rhizophilum]
MSSYPLRLPDHVLEEARRAAAEDNVSLNQLLSSLIADGIGHRRAILALHRRAERGDPAAALSVLDKVPADTPDPGDTIP